MRLLSLIMPVRNQADHIQRIARAHLSAFENAEDAFELILVVNGSADDSVQICRRLSEEDSRVHVIALRASGWGRAVRAGLACAEGDVLSYSNSARTLPHDVVRLLEAYRGAPHALIKATRTARSEGLRQMGSSIYTLECRWLFGLQVQDVNGTPKVFSRHLYHRLQLRSDGDLLDAEVLAKCRRLRVPIVEVEIPRRERHGGRASTSLASALQMYVGAVRMYGETRTWRPQ